MTPEQRLTIRAELARRMGWTQRHTTDIVAGKLAGDWIKPDGSFHDREGWPPDPFTRAEDKDALVAWICANDYKSAFGDELLKALGIRDRFLGDRFPAEFHIADILNASREIITLAAARALSIREAGE